jgi:hypothetical protein
MPYLLWLSILPLPSHQLPSPTDFLHIPSSPHHSHSCWEVSHLPGPRDTHTHKSPSWPAQASAAPHCPATLRFLFVPQVSPPPEVFPNSMLSYDSNGVASFSALWPYTQHRVTLWRYVLIPVFPPRIAWWDHISLTGSHEVPKAVLLWSVVDFMVWLNKG